MYLRNAAGMCGTLIACNDDTGTLREITPFRPQENPEIMPLQKAKGNRGAAGQGPPERPKPTFAPVDELAIMRPLGPCGM